MPFQGRFALFAQAACAFFNNGTVHLRHARSGCAWPERKREDVELRQSALVDQIERANKHVLIFSRKASDNVGAEHNIGAQTAYLLTKGNRIATRMTPFHAL